MASASPPLRITVWNEYRHERTTAAVRTHYPNGIHETIKTGLELSLGSGATVRCATLDQTDHGLTADVLASTDVLIWWGHVAHDEVRDEIVDAVHARVLAGMGLIVLHSGHYAKIFRKLMGTGCGLRWRVDDKLERLWCVNPGHPITDGLGDYFELPQTEMYGELFDVPPPDETVFISWFEGGEVFRSGCCWTRGKGRVFYFRPGHETYPIYHDDNIQRVLANAARWAAPKSSAPYVADAPNAPDPPHR